MADKTYRMTVGLSNGQSLDAGTFVAPQGPQGPAGESGGIDNWKNYTNTTRFENNSLYIIDIIDNVTELDNIALLYTNGTGAGSFGFSSCSVDTDYKYWSLTNFFVGGASGGKIVNGYLASQEGTGATEYSVLSLSDYSFRYIKLK